jgi:Xaa-Pro aminopeptidase
VGVVGTDLLSGAAYRGLTESLSAYQLREFDAEVRALRASKRPREVATVRAALRIATEAAAAAEQAFAGGASTSQALVEAERAARVGRAHDFRALANVDGDELRPFEGLSQARRTPLLLWTAAEYAGYWADLAVCWPQPPNSQAEQAVSAMAAAARAGARAGEVARAGLGPLSPAARESALAYGLGGGLGLALNDWPVLRPDSDAVLPPGALLTLRALARDAADVSLASAIVQVGAAGGTRL